MVTVIPGMAPMMVPMTTPPNRARIVSTVSTMSSAA